MACNTLYENQSEMKLHTEVIRNIALNHRDVPQKKVIKLYEFVLRRYKAQARVKDFLVVLAAKRVEQLLRKSRFRR